MAPSLTEVTHTSREGYVREERGEPLTVNLRQLPVTTEPDGLSLRGIEKKAVERKRMLISCTALA